MGLKVLKNLKGDALVCLESASTRHHLSTFPKLPLILKSPRLGNVNSNILVSRKVDMLDLRYCEKIGDNLYITNKERTICDMIREETEERFIYESLESYLYEGELEDLLKVAREYEIESKVREYVENTEKWLDDFYDHS